MNNFAKSDKTVLVVFVVLYLLVSSVARAVGIKMATSISFLGFAFLYILYILVKQKVGIKKAVINNQGAVQHKVNVPLITNYKLTIGIVLALVIVFGFYWYELRPNQIKKDCYRTARESAIKNAGRLDDKFYIDEYNNLYKMCLQKKGM